MAIKSDFELLTQTSMILRGSGQDKKTKAFKLFTQATSSIQESVYERLAKVITPAQSYWRWQADAFNDANGLSSSSDQKAMAIEIVLAELVAAMKLRAAPNLRDLHYFLNNIAKSMLSAEEGPKAAAMEFFSKLPEPVRQSIYAETFLHHEEQEKTAEAAFHNQGELTSTPEERAHAIHCYLLRDVSQLVLDTNEHALALELFSRLPAEHTSGVLAVFRKEAPEVDPKVFFDTDGLKISPRDKSRSIVKYLNSLQESHRQKLLADIAKNLSDLLGGVEAPQVEEEETLRSMKSEPSLTAEEVEEEAQAVKNLLVDAGARTLLSNGFIKGLSNFMAGGVQIEGKFFAVVNGGTQGFSRLPLASCGSADGREILYLDPQNCPHLSQKYTEFRATLTPEMSTEQILRNLHSFIQARVFRTTSVEMVDAIVAEATKRPNTVKHRTFGSIPLISLDEFVSLQVGVCRHHALLACYIIDRMLSEENPLLDGTVQQMRGNLEIVHAAHTWVAFIPKGFDPVRRASSGLRAWKHHRKDLTPEKWHFDTTLNVLANFARQADRLFLRVKYGEEILAQEIERTAEAAKLNSQPVT